jgi:hypothetical protein
MARCGKDTPDRKPSSRYSIKMVLLLSVRVVPLVLAVAAFVAVPAARAAQVPTGKEVMILSHIPGKLGPVRFTHAEHATKYRRPDGTPIRCKTCHHTLAAEEPGEPLPDMRCTLCHVPMGQPEKEYGGKPARSLAGLKPDGAIDLRTVLFHDQCRGCHLKVPAETLNLATCKVCHPRGLSPDAIHGRYDAKP